MTSVQVFQELADYLEGLESVPTQLLAELKRHHQELRFVSVDYEMTWRIGSAIRQIGVELGLPIAIDASLGQQQVFHAALPGSSHDNDEWAKRKAAVVARYNDSSLAVGFRSGSPDLYDRVSRLPLDQFAAHGGGFPILLTSGIAVGAFVVSGLKSSHDHALVVTALAAELGVSLRTQ